MTTPSPLTQPGGLWIVVVGYNGADDTALCLESIARVTGGAPQTVYVDNASASGVADRIEREFGWCHIIRNPLNEGYAGGNNRGIEYALARGASSILILNNDTVVAPELVETLAAVLDNNPDYGVIGPIIGFIDERRAVMTDGCRFNRRGGHAFFERQEIPLASSGMPVVYETDIVNGCCLLIRAECARQGGFDEAFFLVHEESELCLRMSQAGFRIGVVDRMLVWHKGSSSFKRTGRRLQRYFDIRNLPLLLNRRHAFGNRYRTASATWRAYWRYTYHMFSVEEESNQIATATAILEGLEDALFRRTGPYQTHRRILTVPCRWLFRLARWSRSRSVTLPAQSN